jgi:hypothetical protein
MLHHYACTSDLCYICRCPLYITINCNVWYIFPNTQMYSQYEHICVCLHTTPSLKDRIAQHLIFTEIIAWYRNGPSVLTLLDTGEYRLVTRRYFNTTTLCTMPCVHTLTRELTTYLNNNVSSSIDIISICHISEVYNNYVRDSNWGIAH